MLGQDRRPAKDTTVDINRDAEQLRTTIQVEEMDRLRNKTKNWKGRETYKELEGTRDLIFFGLLTLVRLIWCDSAVMCTVPRST